MSVRWGACACVAVLLGTHSSEEKILLVQRQGEGVRALHFLNRLLVSTCFGVAKHFDPTTV